MNYFVFNQNNDYISKSDTDNNITEFPNCTFYKIPEGFNELEQYPYLDNGVIGYEFFEDESVKDKRKAVEIYKELTEDFTQYEFNLRYYLYNYRFFGFNTYYGYANYPHANSRFNINKTTGYPILKHSFKGIYTKKSVKKIELFISGKVNISDIQAELAICSMSKIEGTNTVSQRDIYKSTVLDNVTRNSNINELVKIIIDVDIPAGEEIGLFFHRISGTRNAFFYSTTNIKLIH